MDLAARKYSFMQELTTVDENLLEKLENILKANKKDWFGELPTDEQAELKIGINQADNKEFVSHEMVMSKFAKWH